MLLQAEAEEEQKMREAEARLFTTTIKLSTWKDMKQQVGRTRQFDLVDHNKVCPADFGLCTRACASELCMVAG